MVRLTRINANTRRKKSGADSREEKLVSSPPYQWLLATSASQVYFYHFFRDAANNSIILKVDPLSHLRMVKYYATNANSSDLVSLSMNVNKKYRRLTHDGARIF